VKLGVLLPSFSATPELALRTAADAEEAALDGVFCYDHLWPMGNPARPALAPFPLLGVVARRHEGLHVGPLVARVGLVDDEVLLSQFAALEALAPGRVVAAVGTGDHLSAEENLAYGVSFAPAAERRGALERCASRLLVEGLAVWIGGGAARTLAIAAELGCAVNLWGATPDDVARQAALGEVTWAGLAPADDGALRRLLADLEAAGATWAVFGDLEDPGRLRAAAQG
jgi:alkanesulfonate monooxygenase SsuD/methylene tetrahydromethanopterin reductase-like flavin-dependent oxidoreductase (luciferase family)